jgi:hypothetical protein
MNFFTIFKIRIEKTIFYNPITLASNLEFFVFQDAGDSPDAPQPREMIDMEATFEKLEHELQEVSFDLESRL